MIISFTGNCQTASLCFYFQQLLGDEGIHWMLYGDEFKPHVGTWANKIKNKIMVSNLAIEVVEKSDVIVHQEVSKEKSLFANMETLQTLKKDSCILIKIPSIHLDYSNFNASIERLMQYETQNNVDIRVSDIFKTNREQRLMLSVPHPNTFLFLELVDQICKLLKIESFSDEKRDVFLKDQNYMKLP